MNPLFAIRKKGRSGMALVLVLVIMALLMVLVLAMLTMGSVETRSSAAFSETAQARSLAEMPVSITMGQIQQATADLGIAKTWASQPGMIRVYGTQAGTPATRARTETVWRLYSSDKMVQLGTEFSATTESSTLMDWDENAAQFTDLNEPVARIHPNGSVKRIFPILSPEALSVTPGTGVAGFSLAPSAAAPGATAGQPLPMPVRWLYVLQDGRLVVPTGGTGATAAFDDAVVTAANPIVGRIAFWTDDETCKVNINTASEGTAWDMPRATGWTDRNYAYYMPAQNEFQRYPGHPAMTSMSAVLQAFDGRYAWRQPVIAVDGTVENASAYTTWLEGIYALLPRTSLGASGESSRGGTVAATSPNGLPMKRERLFASVDEFFFGPGYDETTKSRQPSLSGGAVEASDLDNARFFLTAHSRAPEVNLFNRPRISLWPVQANLAERNAKDKLLAFCATTAGERAYFQRAETWKSPTDRGSSQSPVDDFELPDNERVFGYLQRLTNQLVPGFGGATFEEKYGRVNRSQILLNMFDLVRWGVNPASRYTTPAYTYLPPTREGSGGGPNPSFLAEGSAVPLVVDGTPTEGFGQRLKSFGHFPSVIEAAVVFMATQTDEEEGLPKDADNDGLADRTTRMRAFIILQPFAPVVGLPGYSPDVRYRIRGLEAWTVNGQSLGFPADAVNHAPVSAYDNWDEGRSSAYSSLHAQFFRSRATGKIVGGGDELQNFPFVSVEVDVSSGETFTFTGGPLVIETHLGGALPGGVGDDTLIQTATLNFPNPAAPWPVPRVQKDETLSLGGTPAVLWDWTTAKRFMNLQNRLTAGNPHHHIIALGDTLRSVAAAANSPAKGDYRLLCALREIPDTYYAKHADYDNPAVLQAQTLRRSATNFTGHYGRGYKVAYLGGSAEGKQHPWQVAGYVINAATRKVTQSYGLLRDVPYWQDCQPAMPYGLDGAYNVIGAGALSRPGDWDNGMGRVEDGPYINQPDTTSFRTNTSAARTAYFALVDYTATVDAGNFSPNRQIASAVAFGSLPSAVHPVAQLGNRPGPWQTLLFSPNPASRLTPPLPTSLTVEPSATDHYGFRSPRDHLLLDLFWMPVVEPYAISEPLSTAGKVNLNQQIMPFAYIQRHTGLHAALRSTRINALPAEMAYASDATTTGASVPQLEECYKSWQAWLRYETNYEVNVEETMKGFQRRFNAGDLFRSASEICEIYLVPKRMAGRTYHPQAVTKGDPTYETVHTWWAGNLNNQMDGMELTGDNTRESPYNQLYPRLTTKSNTFQVHFRVQILKKARSTGAATWDETRDALVSEQRGSTLMERYVDPNDPSLPGFLGNSLPEEALDDHYRFRVIARKAFAP